eukprot:m.190067 g.190067  ORF g.190067 m.190067 type:complete len:66 (-) comp15125_c0_seq2:12-209(-)
MPLSSAATGIAAHATITTLNHFRIGIQFDMTQANIQRVRSTYVQTCTHLLNTVTEFQGKPATEPL